jgi:hypothetical protein
MMLNTADANLFFSTYKQVTGIQTELMTKEEYDEYAQNH